MSLVLRIGAILVVIMVVLFAIGLVLMNTIWSPERVLHYSHEAWAALEKVHPAMTKGQIYQLVGPPHPPYVTHTSPYPDWILSEDIEVRRDEVAEYVMYRNGIDNVYIIAFDADGLVIGKAYMWEGPMWEEKEGTIRSRPKEQRTEQAAEPEAS